MTSVCEHLVYHISWRICLDWLNIYSSGGWLLLLFVGFNYAFLMALADRGFAPIVKKNIYVYKVVVVRVSGHGAGRHGLHEYIFIKKKIFQ